MLLVRPLNARVVRFRLAFAIFVDRQLLPLTTQTQDLPNVVENPVKAQLRGWTPAAGGEIRQDKLLELCKSQVRRNPSPALRFHPKNRPYAIRVARQKSQDHSRSQLNSAVFKNLQPVDGLRLSTGPK